MNAIDFWGNLEETLNGCWEWKGCKNNSGYGSLSWNGKVEGVHRVAWMLTYGKIPKGFNVLHKCDNRPCCNPDHLFLGTYSDNTQDMLKKGRGWAPRGIVNHNAKLNDEIVRFCLTSDMDCKTLAKRFGVKFSTMWHVLKRKTWKHIPRPSENACEQID